ncbi:ABC transporter ATP-binding protein [Pontibacter harenae]|uniref:ABC transporter ATP-binding protein n=1 Tax=Pontibacter harenae TaxID=2894083 RepID=UPI001E28B1D5|nr:ABC transporter ATP-binding protein [Pontibacter harenae]MCC9168239.1 ABC transporter ATP-binding protein [Pontibacter harenae]
MGNTVIKVEDLSKQYRLGEFGSGTITHDINRWWHKIRGKNDPYLKIGETNNRAVKGDSEYVWSLRDINFDVKQGDAVGIIGRNGAGKSTLLKLLSRTTAPTLGSIKIRGRVASLLEVGTGFHPELSGRENIFLNGAILGMSKTEIKRKFDEIVDFSGVERYIDTPVKRYSSGMYVRLAFAVAAHLESEIMIVDEVLAVGDYEFQRKCLGKMQDVSGSGRTVLFVSHNIGSIKALCNKGIYLKHGNLIKKGDIHDIADLYMNDADTDTLAVVSDVSYSDKPEKAAYIKRVWLSNNNHTIKGEYDVLEQVYLNFHYKVNSSTMGFSPMVQIEKDGMMLFYSMLSDVDESVLDHQEIGEFTYRVKLPYPLKKGKYSVNVRLSKLRLYDIDAVDKAIVFHTEEVSFDPTNKSFAAFRAGLIANILDWKLVK